MNNTANKETYILDDSIAFELMDLLKAKARHFIQLNEYVYRLFDGQSVVTFTTLENNIQVEMVKGQGMKFKTFNLRAYHRKDETILSFVLKGGRIPTSRILYIKKGNPFKMKITHEIAEKYRIKQEIKQTRKKTDSPNGLYPLIEAIEKDVSQLLNKQDKDDWEGWKRVFAYEYLYDVAFNRGVRQERQRRKTKHKAMTAFDIISSEDVSELSNELGISEDKLTYAVMEVISKRKNGGKK